MSIETDGWSDRRQDARGYREKTGRKCDVMISESIQNLKSQSKIALGAGMDGYCAIIFSFQSC